MERFDEIIGHERTIELLTRMLDERRVPHALLFHGPGGVGKGTLARTLAAALLCDEDEGRPCNRCSSCHLFDSGNHPDYRAVVRLPKKSARRDSTDPADLSSFIVVDQIRELAQLVGLAPRQARHRVFLIDEADRMNAEAQNALLKTLEEPPGSAVLILVSERPHALLPTVRSRSFSLAFEALDPSRLAERLRERGIDRDEAERRAALSEGRAGLALTLDVEELDARREELLETLEALTPPKPAVERLPELAGALAGRDDQTLQSGLDLLESLLRDLSRVALDPEGRGLIHHDLAARLRPLAARLDPKRSASLIESSERLRRDLRFHVNRTLVAESLLAALAGGDLP